MLKIIFAPNGAGIADYDYDYDNDFNKGEIKEKINDG